MHRPIFGHSFAVLVAPILVSVIVFNFLNKKKASARRNAKDADAGASANPGGSSSSPAETNDGASCSSPTETDNSPSSSSTASTGNSYEVFLSFRGPDTPDGFTSHLYKELLRVGIHTFRDDDELPLGKSVGPELMAAIQKSRILIPILSVTYGTSSWCLDELVRIMECENNKEQMVLPIFYKVKPAEVRHQIGSFGEAFSKRERRLLERPSFDPTILGNWKKALAEVSKLKGYEVIGNEAELVELIVREVLRELKKKFELAISENLVGIDSPMKEVMEFINNKSHVTLFVGIYGMGGIGKTTFAKAIYNKLSNQFEYRSFIADIRELSNRNGVHYLQKQLICDILRREIEVCNKDEGANLISSRFRGKKVLILLDDVDNVAQLNYLVGNRDWFSLGSIIIITTRNQKILKQFGVDIAYEHKEMDEVHSLILFSKHAFRRDSPPREFEDLARKVVSTTGGLPLTLEILGSKLCGETLEFWRGKIDKLKEVPDEDVQKNISYEALNYTQKQIFLDIACFFIGTDSRIASYMWEACDFFPIEGIEVLRFMSLIKIEDDHKLSMHNQLRDLGRMIVRKENEQPCHRSRLWNPEEALEVLKQNKGTDKIEAINLGKGSSEGFGKIAEQDDDIYTAKEFKNLTCLRFLNLEGARLRGDFEGAMKELKCLRWPHCPKNFEVQNFHVKKLAVLELSWSVIDEKWKGWSYFMMAEKLKFLDLSYCEFLENIDFISTFKNLEVLILNGCRSLQQIDSSIGDMKALLRLELCWCESLMELPTEIGKLKALEQLLLHDTYALSALPDSIGSLENLEILHISHSGIEELPNSIGRLRKLQELDAFGCRNLRGEMPESMYNLSSLRRLDYRWCSKLQSLPDLPSSLTYLGVTCQSHELPSLSLLDRLESLNISRCTSIERLDLSKSVKLKELDAGDCEELAKIHGLDRLEFLESLNITGCTSIKRLDLSQCGKLKKLYAEDCDNLVEIHGLDRLEFLESLNITGCTSIKKLDLPIFGRLKELDSQDCENLAEIQGLDRLEFLECLNITRCTSIEWLDLPKYKRLKKVDARDCINLSKIQGLDSLEFLVSLDIEGCPSIERLDLPKSKRLEKIDAGDCLNLAEIRGLDSLEFLERLDINGCTSIERLCFPNRASLKILKTTGCKNLAEIQGLDILFFLETLDIDKCLSIERLLLPKSGRLKKLDARCCENLAEIQGLDSLEFLETLNISKCTSIERLDLSKCRNLKELDAVDCNNLAKIHGLDRLKFLESLNITGCTSIERLNLPNFGRLKELDSQDCKNLAEIQGLDRLEFLECLNITRCTSIEMLDLPKSKWLKKLEAGGCKNLAEIQGLDRLEFLEELHIEGCTSIMSLDLPKFGSIKKLKTRDCENLAEIQGLDSLEFLESLDISGCTSIEKLFLPEQGTLKALYAESCKKLAEIQGLNKLEFLEMLYIQECTSIKRLDLSKSGGLKKLKAGGCKNLAEIQGLNRLEFLEKLYIEGCTSIESLDLPKSGRLKKFRS